MITVYSTPSCQYCVKAKDFLREKGLQFKEVNLLEDETLRNRVIEATGQRKVPVIEVSGKFIVGFDSLKEYFDEEAS